MYAIACAGFSNFSPANKPIELPPGMHLLRKDKTIEKEENEEKKVDKKGKKKESESLKLGLGQACASLSEKAGFANIKLRMIFRAWLHLLLGLQDDTTELVCLCITWMPTV